MKIFTITRENFLEWYFNYGQDSENKSIREEIAEKLIENLFTSNLFTVTTEDIFENCNKGAIRMEFIEEFKDIKDVEGEISDIVKSYKIILI